MTMNGNPYEHDDINDDTPATKGDVARVEQKLDTLINIFSQLGEQMESVFSGGGMSSIVKGLMGRE